MPRIWFFFRFVIARGNVARPRAPPRQSGNGLYSYARGDILSLPGISDARESRENLLSRSIIRYRDSVIYGERSLGLETEATKRCHLPPAAYKSFALASKAPSLLYSTFFPARARDSLVNSDSGNTE